MNRVRRTVLLLQEFSIPLIGGVIVALFWANLNPDGYHEFLHHPLLPNAPKINIHFLVNDIFMVFFFGIATVEIVQSCLPGGDLNPLRRAISPLFATLGGVLVPALVYMAFVLYSGKSELWMGWGIPTATDIALAWLVARFIFGAGHPAVSFLLLLAIADDAIGLGIIAVFYPSPDHPPAPIWLLLVLAGMVAAFILRKFRFQHFWPYLLTGGVMAWFGLLKSGLHPALTLVFIVPFMPALETKHPGRLFEADVDRRSTLADFEHAFKAVVDFGLFAFGLVNAGVMMTGMGTATWYVLFALLIGKTVGVWCFSVLGQMCGFPLPKGMDLKHTFVVGLIASIGLTVALFVAGVAFTDPDIQGAAKMGALLSVVGALLAFLAARVLGIKPIVKAKA